LAVFDLDVRLYRLGKKGVDLIRAINDAEYTYQDAVLRTDPMMFSRAKNGLDKTPKALFTIEKANEIVNTWETEAKKVQQCQG
jgi:hypothetical protein